VYSYERGNCRLASGTDSSSQGTTSVLPIYMKGRDYLGNMEENKKIILK
jgi:hypothetical protein